ncbi:MAG: hypothetical protein WCD86_09490 [Ktedonobacteraceae bacterium]
MTNSAVTGSSRRALGLSLSSASIILALLGVIFFQSAAAFILAVIAILFAARVFALWLSANRRAASSPRAAPGPRWTPVGAVPEQQGQIRPGAFAPSSLRGGYPQSPPRLSSDVPPALLAGNPAPVMARPALSAWNAAPAASPAGAQSIAPMPGSEAPALAAASIPYVPIDQDPLFQLDAPVANERCFLLPKEGEPLVECQDRFALHINGTQRCYAVADGVAGSFVPGPWARIVAKSFVERGGSFADMQEFQGWLADCSRLWHSWIERRWVPTINALRERNGDNPGDWSNEIRQGAQTTLIGCSLAPAHQVENDTSTAISVFAVGDAELLLFTPGEDGGWNVEDMFPFDSSKEFDAHPDTLVTAARPDLVERAWQRRKTMLINAFPGDLLVLTTDTLAKWLLQQIEQDTRRWMPLLSISDPGAFEQHIRREFHNDQVDDDDMTLLVIPIT